MKPLIFLFLSSMFFFETAKAGGNDSVLYRPFQFGFVTPIGTNGLESGRCVNRISINILGGYSYGNEGFEAAGIANINRKFSRGFQVAGFANYSGGDVSGLQTASFADVALGPVSGVQASGFGSLAIRGCRGLQASGFSSLAIGSFEGVQGAGYFSMSTAKMKGVQVSGFCSFAGSVEGLQAAGFGNICTGDIKGVQVSGFINIARRVNGVQIGIINIADSAKGPVIGLFSFVRNGYHRFDVSAGEVFYANLSVKSGMRGFYNILSFGMRPEGGKFYWGLGYGIGSRVNMGKVVFAEGELKSYLLGRNHSVSYRTNFLNRLELNLGFAAMHGLEIFAGGAANLYVTSYRQNDGGKYGYPVIPWVSGREQHNNTAFIFWPGFQGGFRFFIQ